MLQQYQTTGNYTNKNQYGDVVSTYTYYNYWYRRRWSCLKLREWEDTLIDVLTKIMVGPIVNSSLTLRVDLKLVLNVRVSLIEVRVLKSPRV